MALFVCNAWVFAVGPPEVNDTVHQTKLIFAATRPDAIAKFKPDVIAANADMTPPYDLADIEISVEQQTPVPNWHL